MMTNELIVIGKIDKALQQNKGNVFPLAALHRKELRELKSRHLGDLRLQINSIKTMKRDEYEKKYQKQILKELAVHKQTAELLNKESVELFDSIKSLLDARKAREEEFDTLYLTLCTSYGDISNLKLHNELRREFILDEEKVIKQIADIEFNEKYGDAFKKVRDEIDAAERAYEEAINFGDLQIVKDIYYMLKSGEKFLEKISKIKV